MEKDNPRVGSKRPRPTSTRSSTRHRNLNLNHRIPLDRKPGAVIGDEQHLSSPSAPPDPSFEARSTASEAGTAHPALKSNADGPFYDLDKNRGLFVGLDVHSQLRVLAQRDDLDRTLELVYTLDEEVWCGSKFNGAWYRPLRARPCGSPPGGPPAPLRMQGIIGRVRRKKNKELMDVTVRTSQLTFVLDLIRERCGAKVHVQATHERTAGLSQVTVQTPNSAKFSMYAHPDALCWDTAGPLVLAPDMAPLRFESVKRFRKLAAAHNHTPLGRRFQAEIVLYIQLKRAKNGTSYSPVFSCRDATWVRWEE